MRHLIKIFILIISQFFYGQTQEHIEKFRQLEPDIWLGIWDKDNSSTLIKIKALSYDDIPKTIDFRGTVVEALTWTDSNGENVLIQTVTGHFTWKDFEQNSVKYSIQDKSELYAYLFQKNDADSNYKLKWRVYDYTECFGVDWFTGFTPKATTITDLNNDGVTEITMPYVSICRGGMDPGDMKIIMYQGNTKYALRGSTMLMCKSKNPYGGKFTESKNLQANPVIKNFLIKHWNRNKCEDGKYY